MKQTTAIVFAAIFLIGLLIFLVMKICETVTARRKKRAEVQRQRRMAIRMRDLASARERAGGSVNKRPGDRVRGVGLGGSSACREI
jgi:heme exporter protein D